MNWYWVSLKRDHPSGAKASLIFGAFTARLHSLLKKSLFSPLTFLWR
jgi:hypothetical protein